MECNEIITKTKRWRVLGQLRSAPSVENNLAKKRYKYPCRSTLPHRSTGQQINRSTDQEQVTPRVARVGSCRHFRQRAHPPGGKIVSLTCCASAGSHSRQSSLFEKKGFSRKVWRRVRGRGGGWTKDDGQTNGRRDGIIKIRCMPRRTRD